MPVSFDYKMDLAGNAARVNNEAAGTMGRDAKSESCGNIACCGLSFGSPSVSSSCGGSFNAVA